MPPYTGTDGDDSYWGGPDADYIEGLGGRDYLLGGGGDDQIFGGDGDDNLHGGDGNDVLDGGSGDDSLDGEAGIDTLLGGTGNDLFWLTPSSSITGEFIDGGDGVDTLQFEGLYLTNTAITFSLANPAIAQDLAGATIVNVERLSIRGSSENDDITGGDWNDRIDGFDGNDRIDGGAGDDNLDGGFGTDTIYGGAGNDSIRGGSGGINDVMYGGDGDDTFYWNSGDALIDGGSGIDQIRIDYTGYGSDLTVNLSNPAVETNVLGTRVIGVERLWMAAGSGNDRLTGGSGDDVLIGNAGSDILKGGAGNDTLSAGDGSDQLYGGAGDDYLHCYPVYDLSPYDFIDGGDGFDTLEFWAFNDTAAINIDLLATSGMIINVEQIFFTGGSGQNQVLAGAANDTLRGGVSNDYFDGRGGDDDIRAGDGNDVLIGGAGNDFLDGGAGGDSLTGGDGNDLLQGWGGNDTLNGGTGDDELFGADGTNTLTGGSGNDLFYGSVADMSGDTITDFSAGDRIVLLDATIDGFTFSLSGSTLTFTGGSLTLGGTIRGTIVASEDSSGGVRLEFNDPRNDFNGDGRSDLLLRNIANGDVTDWLGTSRGGMTVNSSNFFANPGLDWQVVGTGDFNGDFRDDILWRHTSGVVTDWLGTTTGGMTTNNSANLFANPGTDWQVVGVGDFNGDNRDDILWRHSSGAVTNWLGTVSGGMITDNAVNLFANPGTDWEVAGIGDFNGDGWDDILWRHSSGAVTDWLGVANGAMVTDNSANLFANPGNDWQIAGIGDFNGDGRDDILWRHNSGAVTDWLGTRFGGMNTDNSANFFATGLSDWQVQSIGDFNGDGRDDIMWRHTNGSMTNWLGLANGGMNTNNSANFFTVLASQWHVQPEGLFV